jgi:hypothetical protein
MLEKLKICIHIYPGVDLEAYGTKITVYLDSFLSNSEELIKDRLIAQLAKYYIGDDFSNNIISYL